MDSVKYICKQNLKKGERENDKKAINSGISVVIAITNMAAEKVFLLENENRWQQICR